MRLILSKVTVALELYRHQVNHFLMYLSSCSRPGQLAPTSKLLAAAEDLSDNPRPRILHTVWTEVAVAVSLTSIIWCHHPSLWRSFAFSCWQEPGRYVPGRGDTRLLPPDNQLIFIAYLQINKRDGKCMETKALSSWRYQEYLDEGLCYVMFIANQQQQLCLNSRTEKVRQSQWVLAIVCWQ